MYSVLQFIIALLPIAVLFVGFLLFKLSAFRTSLLAWVVELAVVILYYHETPLRVLEQSLWGILTIWAGFLVLYTGQIFGQAYRATGLLAVLLNSVGSILPAHEKQAKALALVAVIGGFIGAFNGFAVYPVVIPGLVALGFESLQAVTAFLVYFGWPQPFVSLFIVPNISNVASHVPVVDIVRVAGLMAIPLVFVSLLGFLKILGFRFLEAKTQILFWGVWLSYTISIILFTQIWPAYGVMMLICGAALSLGVLYVYGRYTKGPLTNLAPAEPLKVHSGAMQFRAYAPLAIGVAIVLIATIPSVKSALAALSFNISLWGYKPVTVGIFTSAGFYIFVTAMVCYLFRNNPADLSADLLAATKRARAPLMTLAVGSALVYLLVDTGQIQLLAHSISTGGPAVYAALSPTLEFLGGMAFGQGLPADFLLCKMQVPVAPTLGIPLAVLVGIVTVMSEAPPNALKPTQIAYTQALVNLKGKDGDIFRICLKWQLLQLFVETIVAFVLVFTWS
ncbi:MAG TPA: L-lactate permease [Acidocella sp.]|nr:L-lactate permease [Acidocella sp.]